ncbi:hypothetical protein CI102_3341 [Trichoderma harzianum]|nr:hypothetical protein CI102_3341 [Trichoderma harzianum]
MDSKLRQPGIFGQLCWNTYTVIALGFAEQPGASRDEVLATLDSSALRLLSAYPFLARQPWGLNEAKFRPILATSIKLELNSSSFLCRQTSSETDYFSASP